MVPRSKVLVIDDGELARVREVLGTLDVDLEHLRGHVIRQDLGGPFDVVVVTVKRVLEFEGCFDLAGIAGYDVVRYRPKVAHLMGKPMFLY